jgi:NAD(P)-dependent dehydrogenase (short-subunit alcohol dehydrogenase family)
MKLLITGANSGIGLRLFRALTECERWGIARRPISEKLRDRRMLFTSCDVTSWTSVWTLANEVEARWEALDGLIHCAGVQGAIGPAMVLNPEAWCATVRANVEGAFYLIRSFYPLLTKLSQNRTKILLFSGGGASKSRPNFSAYATAKTALVRLTECLADEWRDVPLDINIIAPGAINTGMTQEVLAFGPEKAGEEEYNRAKRQLLEGGDSVAKLIGLIRFLLSNRSDGISGRFISAQWDPWEREIEFQGLISDVDVFKLRRRVPEEYPARFVVPSLPTRQPHEQDEPKNSSLFIRKHTRARPSRP